jgi:hypothetical protein
MWYISNGSKNWFHVEMLLLYNMDGKVLHLQPPCSSFYAYGNKKVGHLSTMIYARSVRINYWYCFQITISRSAFVVGSTANRIQIFSRSNGDDLQNPGLVLWVLLEMNTRPHHLNNCGCSDPMFVLLAWSLS